MKFSREHEGTEYDHNLMINILHDEWPVVLSNKAAKYKNEGFDGIFDWWHNGATANLGMFVDPS